MMTLAIYLRDLTKGQAKFLVEIRREAKGEDEYLTDKQITELFKEFIEKVKAKLPIKSKKVDVWIGMWTFESQFTLEFPVEFLNLVSQNNWKVTFDLND